VRRSTRAWIAATHRPSSGAERLFQQLLLLARARARPVVSYRVDLAEIAQSLLDDLPAERQVRRRLSEALTDGDPALLEAAAANLLENAVRYNVTAGAIELSLWTAGQGVPDRGQRRPLGRATSSASSSRSCVGATTATCAARVSDRRSSTASCARTAGPSRRQRAPAAVSTSRSACRARPVADSAHAQRGDRRAWRRHAGQRAGRVAPGARQRSMRAGALPTRTV
jgi:hypothetical protein